MEENELEDLAEDKHIYKDVMGEDELARWYREFMQTDDEDVPVAADGKVASVQIDDDDDDGSFMLMLYITSHIMSPDGRT